VDDQAREFGGNLVRSIGDETRDPAKSFMRTEAG
jgi:hypothetical protein